MTASVAKPHQVHLRLTPAQRASLGRSAREMHLTVSSAAGVLIQEAVDARREKADLGPRDPEELQLHILVAAEQLIALVESIHPDGPGTAAQMLPRALAAAKDRIVVRDVDESSRPAS